MIVSFDAVLPRIVEAPSGRALLGLAEEIFREAGFDIVLYSLIQQNFEQVPITDGARLSGWPNLSRGAFDAQITFDFDPVVVERIADMEPFFWRDLAVDAETGDRLRETLDAYRTEGILDGVMLPVSSRAGNVAVVSLTGRNARFDLSRADLLRLQHVSLALHRRYEELQPRPSQARLSPRELEVMKLAAVGKTSAEIAETLGISIHTVNTLVRRSYVKLGASNRVQASIKLSYLNQRRS